MPRGVVGFELILGAYPPLSIAAMPPVSLVGLSWAMDPWDRFAYSVRGAPSSGQSGRDGVGDQHHDRSTRASSASVALSHSSDDTTSGTAITASVRTGGPPG